MADLRVDGAKPVETGDSKPKAKVEKQETDEPMFEFSSALETATDLVSKWYENVTIGPAVAKGAEAAEKMDLKGKLHKTAEKAQKYKEEHPILTYMGVGLLPNIIIGLDKLVNE